MKRNKLNTGKTYIRVCIVLCSMMALTGCLQSKKADLQAFVDEVKAQEKAPIDPIPEIKIHKNFTYAAEDERDPFKSAVVETQGFVEEEEEIADNGIRPNQHRLKEALETYDLADLRLVGILEKGRKSAMVRAPDGVVHLVNVGNYIGKNNGKIRGITDSGLTIKEIVPGEKFAFVERDNTLLLGAQN